MIATEAGEAGEAGEAAVSVMRSDSPQAEAEAIADRIAASIKVGGGLARPGDFAVLYRTNAQSLPLEQALRTRGVPYRLRGAKSFFDRAEVKDCLSYARLLVNSRADGDFERVLNLPHRGLGEAALDRLQARVEHGEDVGVSLSLMEAAAAEVAGESFAADAHGHGHGHTHNALVGKRRDALASFVSLMTELRQPEGGGDRADADVVLRECLVRSGYMAMLTEKRERGPEDGRPDSDRLENVEALLRLAARIGGGGVPGSSCSSPLGDFVDACVLPDEEALDEGDDVEGGRVVLMTLHASKGLEYRCVFIAGFVEGGLPYYRSMQEGKVEEERRLCYVGVTRARDRLVISIPRTAARGRFVDAVHPSRFLVELGNFSIS